MNIVENKPVKEVTMRLVTLNSTEMVEKLEAKVAELSGKLDGHKKNPDYYKTQREMRTLSILKSVLSQSNDTIELLPMEKEWFDGIVEGIVSSKIELPQEGERYLPFLEEHPNWNLAKLKERLAKNGLTVSMGKVVRL